MSSRHQTFIASREEIGLGVDIIVRNVSLGRSTTALVLPPRTGKSDLIRAAALELNKVFQGAVSVVLAPWLFLRNQMIDHDKVMQMCKRLRVAHFATDKLESGLFADDFYLQQPARDIWAMTIAAASQEASLIQLEQAANNLSDLGRRLIIFIDEGHLVSSDQSGWGGVAARLEAAGAHVVLLTGTPYRSDNIAPFGFEVEELERQPISYKVPGFNADGTPIYRAYTAERLAYRLKADYEFSRTDAWQKGYLSSIMARWFSFHVDGQEVDTLTNPAAIRKALAKSVRDSDVIRRSAELLVDDVATRRHSAPTSAAIVFVGNDTQNETEDDRHTNQVKSVIETVWRLRTGVVPIIVTAMQRGMKQEEAANRIRHFIGTDQLPGVGDILLVKQMGGVGLDAGRIKTALDLSVVRTISNTTQRWLRIATPWTDDAGKPLATNGTLILPNDPITQRMYAYIVKESGGDCTSLQNKVRLEDIERDPPDETPDIEISNAHDAGVTDLGMASIGAAKDALVSRVLRQQPKLALGVEIARRLDSGQITITAHSEERPADPTVDDLQSATEHLWGTVNDLAKKYCDALYSYGVQPEAWVHCRKLIISEGKRHAGITVELRACHDKMKLQALIEYIRMRISAQ